MVKTTLRKKLSDLDQGIFETSATSKGNYRTSWIMKLRHIGCGLGALANFPA
jgi:hypothetical protein